ncbi:serine protease, partial [Pyxidicoccus fallax]|nr:serine protease [Pyxidicoccus fallax]
NSVTYTPSNTNNATASTANKVLALTAGDKVTVATCGLTGATFTGDTYLRVNGPTGTEVGANDDACSGRGSSISFTAASTGNFEIRAGCYSSGSCGGTVVWTIEGGTPPPTGGSGSQAFTASNTNSAQQNTTNANITLAAGQTIRYGTCTVTGASGTGDTYLRLYNAAGAQVSFNDDGTNCGTLSYGSYTVPANAGGTYQLRIGCYSSNSCSGTAAWTIQ